MARLNEPLVPTDNIDTLRRKFLRQNRDIARINSTQSLRIRSLENECARMLSENLDLRGQILRLETELQENRSQRIADHALAIKQKMEAQLVEWGTMLAGLGHEPIPRNRSPRATKKAKRSSIGRSSIHWRRRDSVDLEALAQQEGRLPPIFETKSYPRETLNREEILAICREATEAGDSPDLGPPPVSRFVDEDPVKIDLPVRQTTDGSEPHTLAESATDPVSRPVTATNASAVKKVEETAAKEPSITKSEQRPRKEVKTYGEKEPEPRTARPTSTSEPEAPAETVKPSLKRKSRDEEEIADAQAPRPLILTSAAATASQPIVFKDKPVNRPIKELPSIKKDGRGKVKNTPAAAGAQRKPLGAKTTNENLSSPRKATTKPTNAVDEVAKAKADAKRDEPTKSRVGARKEKGTKDAAPEVFEIPVPAPEPEVPVTTANISIEPTAAAAPAREPEGRSSARPSLPVPESPEPTPAPREEIRDTPPPLDISSRGETTRGSRRTRTTVSYAEPNLRDKMRRPTKQLFDAVAGEGKNQMRRASQSKRDELPTPASATSSSSASAAANNAGAGGGESRRAVLPDSPLAQKTSGRILSPDDLPTTVITDRKKRNSTVAECESRAAAPAAAAPPLAKSTNRRLEEIAAREAEVARMFDGPDDDGEPRGGESRTSTPEENHNSAKAKTAPSSSSVASSRPVRSRRLSSMAREDVDMSGAADEKRASRNGGTAAAAAASNSRKRASMMAPAKSKMGTDEPPEAAGLDSSSLDGDSAFTASSTDSPAKDRTASTRRRSMML